MKNRESIKNEMRSIIQEELLNIGVYMYQTMGFPLENYTERIQEMETVGEQMAFTSSFRKDHRGYSKVYPPRKVSIHDNY